LTPAANHEIDDRICQAMQDWASAGTLPLERSYELERMVYQMSHRGRRGKVVSVLRGAIAALAAYITMLFFACPAAGSILPAAEFLVEKSAYPTTVLLEQVAYNPAAPAFSTSGNSHLKGAQS